MSERGRALDILVLGLGGAGGRLAGEMARRGYRSVVFHTSRRAADAQEHVAKERNHFIGDDAESGTGGDPRLGGRLIGDQSRRIADIVRAEGRDASVILVTAGLGGGTGSAVAELVQGLDRSGPSVVVLGTLPTAGATAETKVNAVRAVHALTRAELEGLILVDHARLADMNADVPLLEYRETINQKIVEPLDGLNRLGGREDLAPVSAFDGSRFLRVLAAGGTLNFAATEIDTLGAEEVSDAISESLMSSWVLAAGVDPTSVSALQIVLEVPEKALAATPVRVVEQLREQWKADTNGASVDVSVYRSSAKTDKTTVRILASCAALPARVTQLVSEAASEAAVVKQKPRAMPELDLAELDAVSEGSGVVRQRDVQKIRPERQSSVPARPLPGLKRPFAPPREETTAVTHDESHDELPGRGAYARIVTRYRNTSNDDLRDAIARRLEQDRLSEHSQVRFHAVDAMAKIGVHVFEAALIAATEDEDPTVREMAERALEAMPTRMGRSLTAH
jgi:cell division GTPase FtsZ